MLVTATPVIGALYSISTKLRFKFPLKNSLSRRIILSTADLDKTFPGWQAIKAEEDLYEPIDNKAIKFKGFIDAVIADDQSLVETSFYDGMKAAEIIDAAYKSVAESCWVELKNR